ncbi:MAG: HlyD family secretion protein [Pseudohongiellaceae bacterium]|jgi:HlyD family secretion protein
MKPFVLILILLGGGFAVTEYLPELLEDQVARTVIPPEGLVAAKRGPLKVTLIENGSLVAKDSSKVDADIRGDAKITWLIEEGTTVEEGEVLCKLDPTSQEEQLEQRELDIVQAQASLDTALTDKEIQELQNQSDIENSEVAFEKAEKQLERYKKGDAPKELRNLEISISEAKTNNTKAQKKLEDSKTLFEREFINKLDYEEDDLAFNRSVVQLEAAKRDLEIFNEFTKPMTMRERTAAFAEAERSVSSTQKRTKSSLNNKEVAIVQYQKRLEKLEKQRDELIEQIEKMVLVAPIPGIVIYGDPQRPWRRESIRVGGEIWGNTTVMTLPDLRVMQVKLRVHEADISKLAEDQRVSVTLDSYPGLVLAGKVTRIATIASGDNQWDNDPEVKKFDVEVTIDSESLKIELKPGVSAKAEVFIEEKEDVLFIPLQCVFLQEGKHLAWTVGEGGDPKAVEIDPGLSNDSYIEILSGLEHGQKVLLYNPNLPTSTIETEEDEQGEDGDGGGNAEKGDSSSAGSEPSAPAAE